MIFDEGGESELGRLQFPRQERHDRLAIPDYFRTIDDDERDIVAFQVVTVGREAQDHVDALYAAEEYSEQYFAHGIAIAATEGMAEALHRRVKREMGIDGRPGPALLVGLPGVPRPRAPRAGLRPAGRRRRRSASASRRRSSSTRSSRRPRSSCTIRRRCTSARSARTAHCLAIGRRRIGARHRSDTRSTGCRFRARHQYDTAWGVWRIRARHENDTSVGQRLRPSRRRRPAGFRKAAGYTRFDIPPATGNSKLAPCDVTVPTPLPETSIVLRLGARA